MKTQIEHVIWSVALLALFSTPDLASAYYDPAVQRWINRDPVRDKGFRVAATVKPPAEGANSFLFVRNGPVNGSDGFGLFSVPPGSADGAGAYWEAIGHCIAIGRNRQKEYEELDRQDRLATDADKWYHCVTSCEMTRTCGSTAAWALGQAREAWQDVVQPGHDPTGRDTARDKRANQDGRNCGGDCKEKRSCEECCEGKGYRRF